MYEKPQHQTATGIARPVRVAFLVDLANCPDALFDAIFADAYGRWGGRRTLIVPAFPGGIDERYGEWLGYVDPDVVYSFVDLTDEAVLEIHERYAPSSVLYVAFRSLPILGSASAAAVIRFMQVNRLGKEEPTVPDGKLLPTKPKFSSRNGLEL